MTHICFSSEIYHLDPKDLIILSNSKTNLQADCQDDVVVLIGERELYNDTKPVIPDTLLKGRETIQKALAQNVDFIPVRIAFVSRINKYDFISPLVRVLRYKYKSYSSNIYHIDPFEIRELKIERNFRTPENAYQFSNPKYQISEDERKKLYNQLKESMQKNGYDDNFPLDIMLCRNLGIQDTLNQGHHRMGVAIDCNIHRVSVMFCAAGQAPKFLHPLFRLIAKFNLWFKHILQK